MAIGWVILIILVAAGIGSLIFLDDDTRESILNPPPDVKFYQIEINKSELGVGSIAIISVNAMNNEFEPVDVTLRVEVIGENAEEHLDFPEERQLGILENEGEVFDESVPIQILAKKVSGKSVPFDIEVSLIVDGRITDSRVFPITIIS